MNHAEFVLKVGRAFQRGTLPGDVFVSASPSGQCEMAVLHPYGQIWTQLTLSRFMLTQRDLRDWLGKTFGEPTELYYAVEVRKVWMHRVRGARSGRERGYVDEHTERYAGAGRGGFYVDVSYWTEHEHRRLHTPSIDLDRPASVPEKPTWFCSGCHAMISKTQAKELGL